MDTTRYAVLHDLRAVVRARGPVFPTARTRYTVYAAATDGDHMAQTARLAAEAWAFGCRLSADHPRATITCNWDFDD